MTVAVAETVARPAPETVALFLAFAAVAAAGHLSASGCSALVIPLCAVRVTCVRVLPRCTMPLRQGNVTFRRLRLLEIAHTVALRPRRLEYLLCAKEPGFHAGMSSRRVNQSLPPKSYTAAMMQNTVATRLSSR